MKQGRSPPELVGPDCPPEFAWLWRVFCELSGQRQPGFAEPAPLSWGDIAAWQQLTRTALSPRDVDLLRRFDRLYIAAAGGRPRPDWPPEEPAHD